MYGLLLYNEYYTTPIQNWEGAYYEVGNNKVARENWSMYFWEGKKGSFFLKECLETHKIEFVTQHVIKSASMATVDYFSLRKPLISCSITIQEIGKETEFNHGTVLFSALSKVQQRIQSNRDFRKKGYQSKGWSFHNAELLDPAKKPVNYVSKKNRLFSSAALF